MIIVKQMEEEPWRFDFFAAMRRLERINPQRPRIGDSATLRDELVLLGQDPFMEFPASNLARVEQSEDKPLKDDLHGARPACPVLVKAGDPCDLPRRPGIVAIASLTLRREPGGQASFVLHWRDPAKVNHAGGMYIYLREAFSPLWGFLYGWTFFTVIQTGTIAAVAVAFARFLSIICPPISESSYIIEPIHISSGYALSLSTAQLVGILVIAVLVLRPAGLFARATA